jgi:hypothetical protein
MVAHIWLVAGYAGSGKTTAAECLRSVLESSGARVYTTAFANRVKLEVACCYNGVTYDMCNTQEGKRTVVQLADDGTHATVRDLLIKHSADMKVTHGNDIWANYVASEIALLDDTVDHVIVHDWRYPNEYDAIVRQHGATAAIHTLRILRDSVAPMDVPSEHQLDMFESQYTILNNGTHDDLTRAVRAVATGGL